MGLLCVYVVPIAALSSVPIAIAWAVRALFGLRAGLIAARVMLALLVLLPTLWVFECSRSISVPPVIIDDQIYDNDGSTRALFFGGLVLVPVSIVSIIIVWISTWSFKRQLAEGQMNARKPEPTFWFDDGRP